MPVNLTIYVLYKKYAVLSFVVPELMANQHHGWLWSSFIMKILFLHTMHIVGYLLLCLPVTPHHFHCFFFLNQKSPSCFDFCSKARCPFGVAIVVKSGDAHHSYEAAKAATQDQHATSQKKERKSCIVDSSIVALIIPIAIYKGVTNQDNYQKSCFSVIHSVGHIVIPIFLSANCHSLCAWLSKFLLLWISKNNGMRSLSLFFLP